MLKIILFRHLFVAVVVFNIMIINNIIKFPWISLIINSFAEFFLMMSTQRTLEKFSF